MAYAIAGPQSFYSSGGNAQYCGYLEVGVKYKDANTVTVTAYQAAGMIDGYGYGVTVESYYGSTKLMSSSGTLSYHPGSNWAWFAKKSVSADVALTSSSQTIAYTVTAKCPNAPYSSGRTATNGTLNVTIPAKSTSYVYYNLNDGAGGTLATDTVGSGITLRTPTGSSVPTGKRFVKWTTEADGSGTSYAGGASYSGNTVTLWAQWEYLTGLPELSDIVCERRTNGEPAADGTDLYVSATIASWGTGGTAKASNPVTVQTRPKDGSAFTSRTVTVTDGVATCSASGFAADTDYDVLITVTNDEGVSNQYQKRLQADTYIIKVTPDGTVLYGTNTEWQYLYGSESSSNGFMRWRYFNGLVFVQGYFYGNASVSTTPQSLGPLTIGTGNDAVNYWPDKYTAQQCGGTYVWIDPTDGMVWWAGQSTSNLAFDIVYMLG